MASMARSIPRLRSIGFMPAATALAPSRTTAWASTVAGFGAGPAGDLTDHLGAHVLELVGQLDLLGDDDAVLGDPGRAIALVEHDVAPLGAEPHLDRADEQVDTAQHLVASLK